MKHERIITAIAAVMIVVVLIGEVIVYTSSTDSFNVDAKYSDGNVHYSVSISGSQVFSVIVMEDGMQPMTELYVYYDDGYASCYETERGPLGSPTVDQKSYIDQLVTALAFASELRVTILSADDLRAAMTDDVSAGNITKGLVVISGALPDTIYEGNTADLVFDWLADGGRLYWLGNLLGAYYSTPTGIDVVSGDYQAWFFGVSDCLNMDTNGTGFVSNDFIGGASTDGLRYNLSLKNNRVKYAVDTTKLTNYRAVGYSDDNTYASIVLTEYVGGNGMICVLAGDYSRNQRSDLVQVLSSGLCYSTDVIGTADGSVKHGTLTGEIDVSGPGGIYPPNVTVYIYLGGYFPVYGRLFS